jgi:hypothetical protein
MSMTVAPTGQTRGVKWLIAVLVGFVVLMSIPSWRKRFLGKYAAIVLAVAWVTALAIVLLV